MADAESGSLVADSDSPSATSPTPQPVAWKLLAIPAVVHVVLHLVTNGRYGMFRDEYYYLACADRLAWGYVDQPAFSIWILSFWKSIFGDSVAAIRILPALCGAGLILLVGATAAQMGGRRWAQLLSALAVAIGGAGLVIFGFYSMNAYDLVFWSAAYYLVVRTIQTGNGRGWLWLGLVLGFGLFNKIGLVVFGTALAVGLLLTPDNRHWFRDRRLWAGGALALAFLLPYVAWNAAHDWAGYEFIENAKRYKIANIPPHDFLKENMLEANPLTLPMWLAGLLWLLIARRARTFRIVGVMFLLSYLMFVLQKSKPYYLAASFPVLMAAGGVAWEGWTREPRWQWGRWGLAVLLVVGGGVLTPMALPLLPLDQSVAYMQRLGIMPAPAEVGHTSAAPQYFSDRFGWRELAETASRTYESLEPGDREGAVIIAGNYGQAGALEYWSKQYELPPVYSPHNTYWLWGPPPSDTSVYLVVRRTPDLLRELFDDVQPGERRLAPHALESDLTVWICRGLKKPISEVWAEVKNFI